MCDNFLHHLSLKWDNYNILLQNHSHVDSTDGNLTFVNLTPQICVHNPQGPVRTKSRPKSVARVKSVLELVERNKKKCVHVFLMVKRVITQLYVQKERLIS